MATITSANSVLALVIPGVYPSPQQLRGFAVDEAFDTEEAEAAVVQVGVDGLGVAGWVPRAYKMTIQLIAASHSHMVFTNWWAAQDVNSEVIYASGVLIIPSVGTKYTLYQGALTRLTRIPNARRVLMPRRYEITWMPPAELQPAITSSPA